MRVQLTDRFIADLNGLSKGLASKAQKLAVDLTRISNRDLSNHLTAGWRLHQLKNSPFVSLSLDMNYRILCKIKGDVITFYRAVKHDLADSPRINNDDSRCANIGVESSKIEIKDLHQSLSALGLPDEDITPFSNIHSEEDFLRSIVEAPKHVADFALGLLEVNSFIYSPTKYRVINGDEDFELALLDDSSAWEIYLHPSQEFIVDYPRDTCLFVRGGAGTGKTVCAWYRIKHIADTEKYVAFMCPTKKTLAVSKSKLESLLGEAFQYCLFLAGDNVHDSLDAIDFASHIVMDEAQDFSDNWWTKMKVYLAKRKVSMTCFYDLNQKAGNPYGFTQRLKHIQHRLSHNSNVQNISLSINYRNSREVATYFSEHLSDALPSDIKTSIPIFQSAPVFEQNAANESDAFILLQQILTGLKSEYNDRDVAVVIFGSNGFHRRILHLLQSSGVNVTTHIDKPNSIWIATPTDIKGHERKAVVCIVPPLTKFKDSYERAISAYVSFSRARDRLFVINVDSFNQ